MTAASISRSMSARIASASGSVTGVPMVYPRAVIDPAPGRPSRVEDPVEQGSMARGGGPGNGTCPPNQPDARWSLWTAVEPVTAKVARVVHISSSPQRAT